MDDDSGTRWIAGGVSVIAAALALAACTAGAETACPAIGWSNALTVELADDWPEVASGSLDLECSSRCGMFGRAGDADRLSVPLTGRSTSVAFDMTAPDSVVVTVLAADGTELTEFDADVDWERIGGSEECGGPMEATVVVPAPRPA